MSRQNIQNVRTSAPEDLLEDLVRAYRPEVYRTIRRRARSREEAEDLTQIAFLDAYAALRRGARPEMPRAWLHAIARNAGARRFRKLRAVEVELDPELAEVADEDMPTFAELKFALGGLTENQRSALLLREVGGLSADEIATSLGLTRGAVETLLFRARRAVRAQFERALGGIGLLPSLWARLTGPLFEGGAAAVVGVAAVAGGVAVVVMHSGPAGAHRSQAARAANVVATARARPQPVRPPVIVPGTVDASSHLSGPRLAALGARVTVASRAAITRGAPTAPSVRSPATPQTGAEPARSEPTSAPATASATTAPSEPVSSRPTPHAAVTDPSAAPPAAGSGAVSTVTDQVRSGTQTVTSALAPVTSALPSAPIPNPVPSTPVAPPTATTPAVTAPTVSAPTVTAPTATVPAVTTPVATTPAVTTAAVTTPAVTTPAVTAPAVTTPTVTTPDLP